MSRSLADVRAEGEELLYAAERGLEEYGHVLSTKGRQLIGEKLETLRAALSSDVVAVIEEAMRALETQGRAVADEMVSVDIKPQSRPRPRMPPELTHSVPAELLAIFRYLASTASKHLVERGRLRPIAAVVERELGMAAVVVDDDDNAARALLSLNRRLHVAALRGDFTAVGTCVEAKGILGARRALLIQLDHEDRTSLAVHLPYELVDDVVYFEAPRERQGLGVIFTLS